MKKTLLGITAAAMALGTSAMVIGQSRPQAHSGTAENKLIGISLYDTGAKVVSMYGSPDEILALNENGSAAGGDGGGGGRGGGPQGGGGGGNSPGVMQPPPPDANSMRDNGGLVYDPFGPNTGWQQARPSGDDSGGASGRGDMSGEGGARGAGGGGGRAGGGGSTGSGNKVIYTRWVYKRNNSRYAFVLDKFNRVIQVEAIGIKNSSVKTRRGITFGSSFASLIKAYNAPDSYEINGDNLVVRFLVRDRVAFRLNRLEANKPQVVTGIVVAAGKT